MTEVSDETIERLSRMDDSDIDFSDIPEITDEMILRCQIRYPNLPPEESTRRAQMLRQQAQARLLARTKEV